MGVYTDSILLENQERLNNIKEILYADESGSCFVDLLKHKLDLCSKLYSIYLFFSWLLIHVCLKINH